MGFRKDSETRPKLQCIKRTVSLPLLVSAPGTSSFTALRGDHPKPDFQEDYKRFASLYKRYLFLSFPVSIGEKTFIWLLSVESNCNQPQILLPHGDLDKTLQNKRLTGRYRTRLVRASTKLPAPEI